MAILTADQTLTPGQELRSDNNLYRLLMQDDGNLVGYPVAGGTAFWDTGTWGRGFLERPVRAIMQGDGNFVLYDQVNRPVWDTGTWGHNGSILAMQDDRNIVIYEGDHPIWASATNIPAPERRTSLIQATLHNEVGWGKRVETTATLYRDGRLVVDSYNKNDNWTAGLRARTLIIIVDNQNRAIMVSDIFADPTRCSIPDFSCASYGRVTHQQLFPGPIGQYAERLDIYHGDEANFVNLRDATIEFIRGLRDVAVELRDAIKTVFG